LKEQPGISAKRLTGTVFLDVAKAFDTVWIDALLYNLTLLTRPSSTLTEVLRDFPRL
jgi:hypothetical protein